MNLEIAGQKFKSRLILGTSRYPNPKVMLEALEESGTEMVTVSIRRLNIKAGIGQENFLGLIDRRSNRR
jgi:thiazole synthase